MGVRFNVHDWWDDRCVRCGLLRREVQRESRNPNMPGVITVVEHSRDGSTWAEGVKHRSPPRCEAAR